MNVKIGETPRKLKHILSDLMVRSRFVTQAREIDALLESTADKVVRTVHAQEELLTEKQVAARWPFLGGQRLGNYRYLHQGPRYLKFGKDKNSRVYYKVADVVAWIEAQYQDEPFVADQVLPETDPGP